MIRWANALVLPVLCFSAGCACLPKSGAVPRTETVEAVGWAPVDEKDALGTRRRALADAQAQAIEKAAGVFLSAQTRVNAVVAIGQEITANARGYIRHYDILSEKSDNGFYKVRIRALVALPGPDDEAPDVTQLPLPPHSSVVVFMETDNPQAESWEQTAATAIEERFSTRGFEIAKSSAPTALTSAWMIRGRVMAYQVQDSDLGAFVSYRGRVSLEISDPATGAVVWQQSLEAPALGLDSDQVSSHAVQNAAALAGTQAAEALARRLENSFPHLAAAN